MNRINLGSVNTQVQVQGIQIGYMTSLKINFPKEEFRIVLHIKRKSEALNKLCLNNNFCN